MKTLYDKLWDDHVVHDFDDDTSLIYIDRHLIHEVTSAQAFDGLRLANRKPWRLNTNLAVPDHNVPTKNREVINDPISKIQLEALEENCKSMGITKFDMFDPRQGIVHVIGPEQGACLPGMTIVCGDSHTSTNGALGALAFGIGTSDVEHVLATQCLVLKKDKNMLVNIMGRTGKGISAKDIILNIIRKIGTAGGTGYAIEFAGDVIRSLSMEGRMTICNMSIEAGSRFGLIAVDKTTIDYVENRPYSPTNDEWVNAVNIWEKLKSDSDAHFDKVVEIDASKIEPQVTWGTSPEMVVSINNTIPDPAETKNSVKSEGYKNALSYMNLKPGMKFNQIKIDKVFIGSCTNSRIEDLREAADIVKGKKVSKDVKLAMVVPGSGLIKRQAEDEGLAKIFIDSGFEWREPGCSMCLGMNPDQLQSGERCASTSNRNFEGRQGPGGRTHLASPSMVAAAAIAGHFVDIRDF
ncbi:MAG: 3-isopropylmalate dehydratase large subunit [Legionellales bacterium]|jgi:3-isopropylmalate/(R)-2-methylmalate dehydratase large subunit|nr:3-isopropylmalate dehydratase large subunit [Legionellales bacterium]|tara:strand:+ start:4876 stop:6270 length:1395 start_codon:yes stop_codon:yes gene_type:complete